MMLMCLLIFVMLFARAFAGTMTEERQEATKAEGQILEETPEKVFTRTIVRPVSYSFISANVQPRAHKFTEETTTFIREDLDDEKNEGVKPEIQKLYLGRRTVLPGNYHDLQHEDYGPLLGEISDVSDDSYDEKPADKLISVATSPRSKFRRLRPYRGLPIVKDVYENPGKRRIGSSIYHGRGIQRLPPIPEVALRPPPSNPNFLLAPRNHPTVPPPKDIEKSPSHSEKLSTIPWVPEPISERPVTVDNDAEEIEEDDLSHETVLSQPPTQEQAQSESKHKDEPKKKKASKKESSKGSEYDEHNDSKKEEKGEKGYKKGSKHEKAEKGHHDKESHSGEYHDEHGEEKKHHKGEGFYGEHHKEEKGEKGKKYGEGKNHKKGHSTHGEHNIVKKNEYIKKTKFYDEDHDDGNAEEHGEYHGQHAEKEGGKKEGGHKKKGYHKEGTGKKGHHDKGHHDEEHGGFEKDEGGEDFYGKEESYSEKKGKKHAKKWEKE